MGRDDRRVLREVARHPGGVGATVGLLPATTLVKLRRRGWVEVTRHDRVGPLFRLTEAGRAALGGGAGGRGEGAP